MQCSLGGIIHFFKPSKATGRPPQNYAHAILGLTIIGLSFWQVYLGINTEWGSVGGLYTPSSIPTWWKVWAVVSTCHIRLVVATLSTDATLDNPTCLCAWARVAPTSVANGGKSAKRSSNPHPNFEPETTTSIWRLKCYQNYPCFCIQILTFFSNFCLSKQSVPVRV